MDQWQAVPGTAKGRRTVFQVRVELYDVRRTKFVVAHSGGLAAITLSMDGKLLATASERGTLVRIHATHDGTKLQVTQARCFVTQQNRSSLSHHDSPSTAHAVKGLGAL